MAWRSSSRRTRAARSSAPTAGSRMLMSDPDRDPDRCAGPLGDLLGADAGRELDELEAVTGDVEELINFFVIEFQRILFAENVWATILVSMRSAVLARS